MVNAFFLKRFNAKAIEKNMHDFKLSAVTFGHRAALNGYRNALSTYAGDDLNK
jgi:hypothetical protein